MQKLRQIQAESGSQPPTPRRPAPGGPVIDPRFAGSVFAARQKIGTFGTSLRFPQSAPPHYESHRPPPRYRAAPTLPGRSAA